MPYRTRYGRRTRPLALARIIQARYRFLAMRQGMRQARYRGRAGVYRSWYNRYGRNRRIVYRRRWLSHRRY